METLEIQKTENGKSSLLGGLFSFVNYLIRPDEEHEKSHFTEKVREKDISQIDHSKYISRDLSWLSFDERVLDQARNPNRTLFERLKFLAITASNLDEFFTIRIGSLYNYLDYGKERTDYSGLREKPFKRMLLAASQVFYKEMCHYFRENLLPFFAENQCRIVGFQQLSEPQKIEVIQYFKRTVYPMLTPMVFDQTHTFPTLIAKTLIFGVVTRHESTKEDADNKKLSFVQVPQNLPRFYVFENTDNEEVWFLPIEEIIRQEIAQLFKNVDIISANLFRLTRNGDFDLMEHEDTETDFIDEVKQKIKDRRLGRVTRMEVEPRASEWMIKLLKKKWEIEDSNIFVADRLIDFTALWQLIKHPEFADQLPAPPAPVRPIGVEVGVTDVFEMIRERDILLHHPYNSFEPVLRMLEQAAEDPNVLAIKITLYRIAKNSRIATALLKAAENGKHVSVLFEVKARFDEENNIQQAQRLAKAGCFVIYGIPKLKTHTKLLQIIRNDGDRVRSYAHLSSGNYNEDTAKLYTDIGLLTCDDALTTDVSEFFNVITGHSMPLFYQNLITAPRDMRRQMIEMIRQEATNAREGFASGICLKLNSLQDKDIIDELYEASQAGVPIKLIVRGICCLRPQRLGLSENISVRSIVGDFLEHTRIFYFHNQGNPNIYGGSADIMVRSFDRRIESLFALIHPQVRQQAIHILAMNWADNMNAYDMQEDGSYGRCTKTDETPCVNIHERFFQIKEKDIRDVPLF